MWLPEQPEPIGVTIGDVGFIDQGMYHVHLGMGLFHGLYVDSGAFRRLFNITQPSDHEINRGCQLPDGYEVLKYNKILEAEVKDYIQKGIVCSENVKKVIVESPVGDAK